MINLQLKNELTEIIDNMNDKSFSLKTPPKLENWNVNKMINFISKNGSVAEHEILQNLLKKYQY